ncbi:juvenile hormone acid O-methyltransferase-like [Leptopilina heterotoma]|uniref:juvenile hormone acid O-methyltransferase-like n=1 Tax=Leptopilina heterotoma TaxID=63436 RepID=UPI001CA7E08F|nr:juvenile hormone acid O-methyltransferase-like [Leptopilina heterotoma]
MENVEEYIKANDLQTRDACDVIEEFTDEIYRMRGRCIDIGCGPGTFSKNFLLPKLHPDSVLIGADVSKQMIKYARKTCTDEDRMDFVELDIETAKIPATEIGRYDNALSFYCLHWIQNPRRAYENIYQLLQPGGKVVITFLTFNSGFQAYLKLSEDPKYKSYMKDVRKFIPPTLTYNNVRAELKKMLEETGFEVIHCSNREKTFVYKSMKILKNHVRAVNPFLHRMPDNVAEEYMTDLVREIVNEKIICINKNNLNKEEYSILDKYQVLVAYFKKPLNTDN